MWLCLNNAFVSAVQDAKDPSLLRVRARKREHLKVLFPGVAIMATKHTDYRYRVFVKRKVLAKLLTSVVMNDPGVTNSITYGNFKDSVKNDALHDLYADFWRLHHRYQSEQMFMEQKKPARV